MDHSTGTAGSTIVPRGEASSSVPIAAAARGASSPTDGSSRSTGRPGGTLSMRIAVAMIVGCATLMAPPVSLRGQEAPSAPSAPAVSGEEATGDAGAGETAAFEESLFEGSLEEGSLFENDLFDQASGSGQSDGSGSGATADPASGAAMAGSEPARTEYLVGGSVVVAASGLVSGGNLTATESETGKLFGKVAVPDYGALYASAVVTHASFQAYAGDGVAPAAADPYELDLELSELHYSFDIAKRLFIRIGNQLLSWGPSRVWSPVDFVNQEHEDSFADLDTRIGKPGLRLHLLLGHANLFGFADFSDLASAGEYGNPWERTKLAGRVDFTTGPFELGFTAYGGMNTQAKGGFDFSGRVLGTTIYGELAAAPAYGDWDQLIQGSLGFSLSLGELRRWNLSAEGFYNSRGRDLTGYSAAELAALDAPPEETAGLYQGAYYLYAALSADQLLTPDLGATVLSIANLQDGSYLAKLSATLTLPRSVPFTAALSYAGGGEEKEFTRYIGDGGLTGTLSTRISF